MWLGSKTGVVSGMSAPAPAALPMDFVRRKGASGMYQQRQDFVPHRSVPHITESRGCRLNGSSFRVWERSQVWAPSRRGTPAVNRSAPRERTMPQSIDSDRAPALEHFASHAAESKEPATAPIMIDGKPLQTCSEIRRRPLGQCCRQWRHGNRLVYPNLIPRLTLCDRGVQTNNRPPQGEPECDCPCPCMTDLRRMKNV